MAYPTGSNYVAAVYYVLQNDTDSQVQAVQLEELPGCTLSTLSHCKRLKALSLTRSGVCAIDSLNGATTLQYAHLKVSIVI